MAVSKKAKPPRPSGGRELGDTLRVWDRYKLETVFWRRVSLIQPAILVVACALMFYSVYSAEIRLIVPQEPMEGYYSSVSLPDSIFEQVAEEITNLLGTFTPGNIAKQYDQVKYFLWEPALTAWQAEIRRQVKSSQSTSKTQLFLKDPLLTQVGRSSNGEFAIVRVEGVRYRYYGTTRYTPLNQTYTYYMRRVPRSKFNPYGVVVFRFSVESEKETEDEIT